MSRSSKLTGQPIVLAAAGAACISSSLSLVLAREGDLVEQQMDRGGDGNGDEGADEPEESPRAPVGAMSK